MTRFYILRTITGTDKVEALCGATIIRNEPIWSDINTDSIVQPMLIKSEDYAKALMDIAKHKDSEKCAPGFSATYTLRRLADLSA